jgi:ribosomal protein S18 acetylase RimI-like enzyme
MGDLELRPSTDADLEVMLDITQRAFRAVSGRAHPMTAEHMRSMRSAPGRDPGRDFPVVVQGGRVVAHGGIYAAAPFSEVYVLVHADPDLDDATLDRCVALLVHAGEAEGVRRTAGLPPDPARALVTDTLQADSRLGAALAGLGFAVERHMFEMAVDLAGRDLTPASWPFGVQARHMRVPEDVEAVSAVFMESFLDHQGDLPFTPAMIGHVLAGDDTRLDVSVLALDADGPVGAIPCRDRPDHGYVWVLGVLRRGRRHGLAQALLTHAFADFAATGTTQVQLEVEADSLTGATRVYERAGMSVHTVHDTWTRPLRRE